MLLRATIRTILLGAFLLRAGAAASLAQAQPAPVTAKDFYSFSQLAEARGVALTQGKPIGFLLTWPAYFSRAPNYNRRGGAAAADFHAAFKDQTVLVNIDHTAGELDRVPKVALDAFRSPAEGGFAPCLCLVNPSFTKLIGIIPLWKTRPERDQSFARFHALITDKTQWWDQPAAVPPSLPVLPVSAPPGTMPTGQPAAASSGFAREMELTRQAEQQSKIAPSPKSKSAN